MNLRLSHAAIEIRITLAFCLTMLLVACGGKGGGTNGATGQQAAIPENSVLENGSFENPDIHPWAFAMKQPGSMTWPIPAATASGSAPKT